MSGTEGSKFRFHVAGQLPAQHKEFRLSQHAALGADSMRGMRTIRSTANVSLVLPRFKQRLPLTIRILPALDPETQQPIFYRHSQLENDFTDWIRQAQIASFVGQEQKQTSFILFDPRKLQEGYSVDRNPYVVLYWAFRQAIKEGAAYVGTKNVMTTYWAKLHAQRAISKPRSTYWVQALVYANGDRLYVDKGTPPRGASPMDTTPVIQIPRTAGDSLCRLLNHMKEEYRGDTSDLASLFTYGDITDPVNGKFVTFYNPAVHDVEPLISPGSAKRISTPVVEEDSHIQQGYFSARASETEEFQRYEVVIHNAYYYLSGNQVRYRKADISGYQLTVHWWDNVLHYPTDEEIALWLVQAFPDFPELFYYAWKDSPWLFTDEVKAVLNNRTVVTVSQPAVQESAFPVQPEQKHPADVKEYVLDEPLIRAEDVVRPQLGTPSTQRASSVLAGLKPAQPVAPVPAENNSQKPNPREVTFKFRRKNP